MSIPAGYTQAPSGYYYYTDGSGPYTIDVDGNATLVGIGSAGGGSSGGGTTGIVINDPEVAKISKIVSGGGVAWVSGLTFRVAASTYYIQGILYSSPQTDITLDAADGTNPRIDVFALTTSGTAVKVTGTPAASPSKPETDPNTQLEVSFSYIAASATTPTGSAATVNIYAEAAEWTTASSANVTMNSSSSPINGTVSILYNAPNVGNYARLTGPADIDLADSSNLVFSIKNAAAWPAASRLNLGFYTSGGALRGQLVSFKPGDYGTSTTDTGTQQVVIPLSSFGANGLAVRRLQATVAGAAITTQFRLDDISLQAINTLIVDESKLHYEGVWNASRLYTLNSIVKSGRELYVAIRANTNVLPVTGTADWAPLIPMGVTVLTDGATITIDCSLNDNFRVTLGGNRTFAAPINPRSGQVINLRILQDGTGSRTATWNSVFKFPGGTAFVLSTAASAIDFLSCQYDATTSTWFCVGSKAFA